MLFKPEKWNSSKVKKIDIFKGVSPWFLSKYRPFFICVFFGAKEDRKKHFFIFWIERMLFRPQKNSSKKLWKKIDILQRGQFMVFVKKSTFFLYVFFSKKTQKERFFDILDRKECFFDLKSEVLKKSKKSKFSKGVSPWLFSKNRPFSYMFFF